MRLTLDPRTRAVLARLPRTSWFAVSEIVLLALLAWQGAQLVWAVATPVDPVGAWSPAGLDAATPSLGALGGFDPFFRLSPDAGPVAVAAVDLKLFGVRADQATGRGSAIIALPDGTQSSFAVGDEIMPGVRLDAVRLDGVTLLRAGHREQLFLDQSQPVAAAPPQPAELPPIAASVPPPGGGAIAPGQLQNEISASPRIENGAVTGFTLSPKGAGETFRAAGLQPGDVLLGVNGQRILNADSVAGLSGQLAGGSSATLEVERNGQKIMVTTQVAR